MKIDGSSSYKIGGNVFPLEGVCNSGLISGTNEENYKASMREKSDFELIGMLRIQSNPFVMGTYDDMLNWEGIDALDQASAIETMDEEDEVKILEFKSAKNLIFELNYLGSCMIYSSLGAIALMVFVPDTYSTIIPISDVKFKIHNSKKIDRIEKWILMDSLIEAGEINTQVLNEGITTIYGIEGFDFYCSSFPFTRVSYATGHFLRGVVLS